ncbi:MAG: T9SS type A sorting domain-containing protein [Prolixibacteraceae bacterium]|nr:T9SS type A sorting domain-containing protein [Prolixibacteraceae bacterium]
MKKYITFTCLLFAINVATAQPREANIIGNFIVQDNNQPASMGLMSDYELVLDSTVQEGYNPDTGTWGKQYKETFEFDSLGNNTRYMRYKWSDEDGGWNNLERQVFEYNEAGQRTRYEKSIWNDEAGYWQGESNTHYAYDENGNQIQYLSFEWDDENREWKNRVNVLEEYTFDYDYTMNQILLPNRYSYMYYSHKIESGSEYEWDTIANELTMTNVTTYCYSEIQGESSVRASSGNDVKVYPNPATGFVTVGLNSPTLFFEVFSLSGERLISKNVMGTNRIDISALQTGLYVYKAHTDNKTIKGKFIVKH